MERLAQLCAQVVINDAPGEKGGNYNRDCMQIWRLNGWGAVELRYSTCAQTTLHRFMVAPSAGRTFNTLHRIHSPAFAMYSA